MKYSYKQAINLLKRGKVVRQIGMPSHIVLQMDDEGRILIYNTNNDTSGLWAASPADQTYARYQVV